MKIDEIRNELYLKIEKFIKSRDYTWTVEDVLDGYEKNKSCYRISYSMGQCIINLEDEIKKLLEVSK